MIVKSLSTAVVAALCLLVLFGTQSALAEWESFDLGGRTVMIQDGLPDVTPLGARGEFHFYESDARLEAHIAAIEEMFNCTIEFVLPGRSAPRDPSILATAVVAGDRILDVFVVPEQTQTVFATAGLIQPLDGVIDHDHFYSQYPATFRWPEESLQVAGSTYFFEAKNFLREAEGLLWNMDLFEREGLPNPNDLVDAGEWTWEAMREMAVIATKDTTGDGEINQWGIDLESDLRVMRSLVASNNGRMTRLAEDGSVKFALGEPEAIEALDFIQGLLEDGVALGVGMPGRGGTHLAPAADFAMRITYAHMITRPGFPGLEPGADRWGLVQIPMGPRADSHISPHFNAWLGAIPIYEEDARGVIEVMRAVQGLSKPYIEDFEAWEDVFWNEFALGLNEQRSLDNWKWMMANMSIIPDLWALSDAGLGPYWNAIKHDGQSPTAAMGSLQPAAQAFLDELYGN